MRILFVVPYVPSLIRARSYNLIRSLHAAGHEITLVCLGSNEDHDAIDKLRPILSNLYLFNLPRWQSLLNCVVALPTPKPLQAVYSWQPKMAHLINTLAGQINGTARFDVVHVEHLRGVQYALEIKKHQHTPPVVWDSVDSISHLFRQAAQKHPRQVARWGLRLELHRTENYERKMATSFDRVLVTSRIDQQAYLDLDPASNISVIPNGVDLDYFQPDPATIRKPKTILFSGKMSYHANISMALLLGNEIMPFVWSQEPETQLVIVGQNPAPEVQKLAEDARIIVTGTVDDLRPYLQSATVAAAPLRYGAGTQFKVLEAMACNTPVVASSLAILGLSARPSEEILVADQPVDIANHLLTLLNDPARAARIGEAGQAYVQREHSWHAIAGKLVQIYQEVMNR